jgi:NADH-quinone oxidoreductase subunit L
MSPLLVPILAPLSAALLILLLRRAPAALALIGVGIGVIASLSLLADAYQGINHSLLLPGLPNLPLRLLAEPLTALLSTMVAVIASLVTIYAVGYMHDDPEPLRFFATLLAFVAAMQTLVLAGDWILLLAAWELIGLSSYLLIGFWYQRPGVPAAASRAFLYTRSADLGLYIAVFILIGATGSSEIATSLDSGGTAALLAGLLLLVAAMGKSAQAPLYDWLQRAMAGPTPVSALLHSATLVAAGAILLIRSAPLMPSEALLVIGLVGGVTSVITGLIALGESDLKRLLAASTSSQYGLMLVAIGAGVPMAALLHLIAHAAIKSSLFLGAGVFQHSRESTALAALHGVGRDRPRVFIGFAIAALALAGIPPLSGFLSKDAIIASAFSSEHALLLGALALAGTLLTGAYMARALRLLWRGESQRRPVAGLVWMGAGIAGLVTLAASLGLAFGSIEGLLALPLPKSLGAQVAGLSAALSGLAAGWFLGGRRLLGPLLPWARQGFAIAGGMDNWVLRPAMAIARACERTERALYQAVLALGRLGMSIGRAARFSDEHGIDGLIHALVRGSLSLGTWVRTLQSGLIHREMAITVAGTAVILVTLILLQL